MTSITTPVKIDEFERLMREADYAEEKIQFLVHGFTKGFQLGYQGPLNGKRFAPNHALRAGNKYILWNKLIKEVELKRCCGPWLKKEIPFTHFIQSPITLIPKKGATTTTGLDSCRLIFDLSWPRGDSLNDHTPDEV